jgi:putative Mg2+ transporter-C (MgtC) family protein
MDTTWSNDIAILLKILLAVVLAGLIGFEREVAQRPAGLRTHMLVGAAAALFVALGNILVTTFVEPHRLTSDPIRIMEAIIVGISFLGAGTIFRSKSGNQVEGLTTGASILFTAAIGISVALEQFVLAIGATLLILFINFGLGRLEQWLVKRLPEEPPSKS